MRILGIDPGLANGAYALIDGATSRLLAYRYIGTGKGDDTGDTQRRIDEQLDLVRSVMATADLAVIEFPTGGFGGKGQACPACRQPRGNARAATLTASSASALLGLAKGLSVATLAPAPVTWRNAIGFRPGQDEALYAHLSALYPKTAAQLSKGKAPHIWDGLGIALYGRLMSTNLQHSQRRPAA